MLDLSQQEYIPLRDVVFNSLRQAIIKGDLQPGERLLEIQLSERMGVSRTPIREAIRKLELEGLVVMVPRKGATVSGITIKHLQDVLEIREALEELAMELACERISPAQLDELKKQEELLSSQKYNEDAFMLSDIDEKFHELIYEATNNPRLIQMLANLREQMYRYRLEYMKVRDKRDKLVAEHKKIVKAIESGNGAEGRLAIREHIASQEDAILASL